MQNRLKCLYALALLASASSAYGQSAAPLPTCPNAEDNLDTFAPEYVRHGKGYALTMEADDYEAVSNVTITVTSADGTASTPVTLTGDTTKVILSAPSRGRQMTVAFDWDQDASTQAGCHGQDVFETPLVPVKAKVGDLDAARLSGAFRLRATPTNYDGKVERLIWRMTPRCDYFACNTRLVSSGDLRGSLKLRPIGSYTLTRRYGSPGGTCTVTRTTRDTFTGEVISRKRYTIRRAFRLVRRVDLRVTRRDGFRGVAFAGRSTLILTPTPRARARHCRGAIRETDEITGVLPR